MSDCPNLVRVRLYMDRNNPYNATEHITEGGLDALHLVNASLELHYDPGVNPHNGKSAAPVWKITVSQLRKDGPYWWSTPGLQHNYDPNGATLYAWSQEKVLWERPMDVADTISPVELNS